MSSTRFVVAAKGFDQLMRSAAGFKWSDASGTARQLGSELRAIRAPLSEVLGALGGEHSPAWLRRSTWEPRRSSASIGAVDASRVRPTDRARAESRASSWDLPSGLP